MNSYCSEAALSIDTAKPGDALVTLVKHPTSVDVVMFCAAIRNYHRYHYDHAYTRSQGIDGIIVPGFLMGNWCIEAASRGFDTPVHIRRLRFRNTAVAPVGGTYSIEGRVVSIESDEAGNRLVHCRFEVAGDDGQVVTTGAVDVVPAATSDVG